MTQQAHTPGPWEWDRPHIDGFSHSHGHYTYPAESVQIVYGDETDIDPGCWEIDGMSDADAARIVACVNACEGLSTAALEAGVVGRLIGALQCAKGQLDTPIMRRFVKLAGDFYEEAVREIRDALALAKGEAGE